MVTVTAYDAFNNVVGSGVNQYEPRVNLSSTDENVGDLPATYTFTAADHGSHEFDGVVLETVGGQTITATDSVTSTIDGTSPTVDVVAGPPARWRSPALRWSWPPKAGGKSPCRLKDASGNTGAVSNTQMIDLSTTSTAGVFTPARPGAAPSPASSSRPARARRPPIYADTQMGTPMVTASDSALSSSSNQTETINSGPATQVAITSTSLVLAAGDRGQSPCPAQDASGNTGAVSTSDQAINLSTTSTAGAFHRRVRGNPVTSVVILAGNDSATFYYTDTQAGTPMVTASDSGLGPSSNQTETVNPGPAAKVAITSTPLSLIAGSRGAITVSLEDSYGNTGATSTITQTISLSTTSSAGAFFASIRRHHPITSVVILAGKTSASVYYYDTKAAARP